MDTEVSDEVKAQREAKIAAMTEQSGVSGESHPQADYFGTEQTHKAMLPDGVSYVEHKDFTEGAKRKYQNAVNRDVTIDRQRNAKIKLAAGDDRYELLKAAIVGWSLMKDGKPYTYTAANKEVFLSEFPPHLIDIVEKDVRDKNQWLTEGADVATLTAERDALNERIAQAEAEAEGKGSLSS